MFQRLRRLFSPMIVSLEFEDRSYKLGESIEVTVELTPRRHVDVKEGRVELVCEERYTETFDRMVAPRPAAGILTTKGRPEPAIMVPKREVREHVARGVHSSVVAFEDARLDRGRAYTFSARLEVQPVPPTHARGGSVTWTLIGALDTPAGRIVSEPRPVAIALS